MAAKKSKTSPYVTQAEADALVRFGPEYTALKELMQDSQDTYTQSLGAARSAAALTTSAANQARPDVLQNYQQGLSGAQQAFAGAAPALAQLGGSGSAAAGLEQAGLTASLAASQARDLTDLDRRKVAAAEGGQYAAQQAATQYNTDRAKIATQLTDLAGEQGSYTASDADKLAEAAQTLQVKQDIASAGNAQQERDSLRSAGIDPDTGQPIPGGKLDPNAPSKKPKWASTSAQSKAGDTIQQALNEANTLVQSGASRAEAQQLLLSGAPATNAPIYETVKTATGTKQQRVLNPDGTPKTHTIPAVPKIDSELLLQAALDQAYYGHLQPATEKRLHANRIQIGPLGVTTYGAWVRKQLGQALTRPPVAPGANGQSRPT